VKKSQATVSLNQFSVKFTERTIQLNVLKNISKVALFIPYIDGLLAQIKDRFQPHDRICMKMQSLMPNFIKQANFNDLKVLELYHEDIGAITAIRGEFERWQVKWAHLTCVPFIR